MFDDFGVLPVADPAVHPLAGPRRLKILLSAFACSPTSGSEGGVGWRYATTLAAEHDVWVITDECRRAELEANAERIPPRLRIVYFRPRWLAGWGMSSRTAYFIFHWWMASVWKPARQLDAEHGFDLCWHLTYGTFRAPSSLWRLGKPVVIGPVGGGEASPLALLEGMSFTGKTRELLRLLVIRSAHRAPGFSACYRNARLVLARTEDTRNALPAWARDKCRVEQEIGGWPQPRIARTRSSRLRLLFAGRLLELKGMHLGLNAFAHFLEKGGDGVLTIVGDGPQEAALKAQAVRLGLDGRVLRFLPRMAQAELFEVYRDNDVLLFPSLHDSGGNVVIEAMSFGMVVVCLDLGGPKCFVTPTSGRVIDTAARSRAQVEEALASALLELSRDPEGLQAMSEAAWRRAAETSYERQIARVSGLAFSVVPQRERAHA